MSAAGALLEAALMYRAQGLSPIHVGRDKKPLVDWKPYQDEPACQDEIERWWEQWPDANVGLVTGKVSGLLVLDVDGPEGRASLSELNKLLKLPKDTWVAATARGWHVYFRHPGNGTAIGNRAGLRSHLDVRGDGGYVVAPPSIHASGKQYMWVQSPSDTPLAHTPPELLRLLTSGLCTSTPGSGAGGKTILRGQRNDTLYRIARGLLAKGLSPAAVRAALLADNAERCKPPLPESDVRAIAEHAVTQPDRATFTRAAEPQEATPLEVPDTGMIGVARDFAELYAAYLESPRSFFYFAFLTYFGSLVAKQITLASELRPEPRLYTVLVGESADTRKSTALRKVDQFFRTLGSDWEPAVLLGVGSAEGFAAALQDRADHSLLLHYDELKSFCDKARAESSVLLPMVTTLFERNEYDNRTKESALSVRGVSLALLAACTSDTYSTMFDPRFFSIGFLNRLWLVADRTRVRIPIPRMIPASDLEVLSGRVVELLGTIKESWRESLYQPVAYEMTAGALSAYEAWYESREGSIFERRLDTYGHRLMVLLAATTGKGIVDDEIMGAVLALLRYQLEARRECDPVNADSAMAVLEERIRRALARGAMRGRDLMKKLHYERVGLWMWKTAVQNLLQSKAMKWDQRQDLYWLAEEVVPPFVPTQMGTLNTR